jgi:alpha-mannosidase
MKRTGMTETVALMLLLCWGLTLTAAENDKLLWQIGKADNHTAEFALGPDRSNQYSTNFPHDVLFVAGQSDPKQDWPYIQPGPADSWAGGKSHVFTILFGLEAVPSEGECKLVLDLVDTHSSQPPKLQIKINDESFVLELPRGAGDASAHGQPDKGREHKLAVDFPVQVLKAGNNQITITSLIGSWILYDQVTLTAPAAVKAGPLEPVNKLLNVYSQPFLIKRDDGKLYQPILASVLHIGEPAEAAVVVDGAESKPRSLGSGFKVIEGFAPAVKSPTSVAVDVKVAGESIGKRKLK